MRGERRAAAPGPGRWESLRRVLPRLAEELELRATGRWMLYGLLLGVVGGLGAMLFENGLELAQTRILPGLAGFFPPRAGDASAVFPGGADSSPLWWLVVLLPALGGLASGVLVFTLAPEAEGHGTDAMIRSFHRFHGQVRARVVPLKALASCITIGTGGSAGKEGPIAQIGSGFGSLLATWLRLSRRDRRLMLLAGASAGLGAIFQAPLGAALFAGEVLYRESDMEVDALIPCLISSIVGYWVFMLGMGGASGLFALPENPEAMLFVRPLELPLYAVLGLICAAVGFLHIRVFYGLRDRLFRRLTLVPAMLRPALGGLLLGLLVLLLGLGFGFGAANVTGGGYGLIQLAINQELTLLALGVLVLGKILATAFTISSGGSGGVFAPTLVIGALLGAMVGQAAVGLGLAAHAAPFALVGMGGLFGGVAKTPIASVIMISEMTRSYGLLAPLMLVCTLAFLFTRRWSLYEEQVPTRLDSQAHRGDFVADFLQELTVAEAMRTQDLPPALALGTPLREVMQRMAEEEHESFPVVDSDGRLAGVLALAEARRVMIAPQIWDLVVAEELLLEGFEPVRPSQDLHTALRRLTRASLEELPVVAEDDPGRIIGSLSRKDIMAAYDRLTRQVGRGKGD